MVEGKKLNRKAFDERLIHRYLLETLYGVSGTRRGEKICKEMFKGKFSPSDVNIVMHEVSRPGYRVDLEIYHNGSNKPVPLEIKWSDEKDKLKQNQLTYLDKNNGYMVSFIPKENLKLAVEERFPNSSYSNINYSELNIEDFREWMRHRHQALIDDQLRFVGASGVKRKNWLISLRAKPGRNRALQNMKNMLNETNKQKRFWALKNNSVSIKNALSMHEGDRVIFLFYRLTPCNPSERYKISHPPPLETKINIHGYIIGKITTGHHFMINQQNPENKETFFEAVGVNVGDRKWPHFFDFEIHEICPVFNGGKLLCDNHESFIWDVSRRQSERLLDINKLMSDSEMSGGTAIEMSEQQYEDLVTEIDILDERKKFSSEFMTEFQNTSNEFCMK